jgi:hypothetical protein
MKRKVKKMAEGGYGRFVDDSPKSVEDMKIGLAAGAPSDEPEVRSFSTTGPEEPKPKPKPKLRAAAPKVSAEDSAKNYAKLEAEEKNFQPASSVMKRGQAGPSASGKNVALESYKRDKKEREFNEARKTAAEERRNTARSTVASSPVTSAGFKKGGKTASARADGCAVRGKTRA